MKLMTNKERKANAAGIYHINNRRPYRIEELTWAPVRTTEDGEYILYGEMSGSREVAEWNANRTDDQAGSLWAEGNKVVRYAKIHLAIEEVE